MNTCEGSSFVRVTHLFLRYTPDAMDMTFYIRCGLSVTYNIKKAAFPTTLEYTEASSQTVFSVNTLQLTKNKEYFK